MRKSGYTPLGRQESFIVPLLAKEISSALHDIASKIDVEKCSDKRLALDCGCGNQPFKQAIVEYGFQYESLDVSQNSFDNVDYVCALDCPATEFRALIRKEYAFVLATEVLEHISDWNTAFSNIASCMQPGGYALLTAPFFYPLHEEPYDYIRPTVHHFEKLSTRAGLEVVEIKRVGSVVDVIGTVLGASRIQYKSSSRISSRLINIFLQRFQQLAFAVLLDRRDQLESDCVSIYLSNVVVLRKALS